MNIRYNQDASGVLWMSCVFAIIFWTFRIDLVLSLKQVSIEAKLMSSTLRVIEE